MASLLKLSKMLKSEIDDFLNLVSEAGILFQKGLELYLKENREEFEARLKTITDYERKADELRMNIERQLYLKTLIPENRGDVLAILENTDDVIDTYKETLTKFYVESPEIDNQFNDLFLELGDSTLNSIEWLVRAIRAFFKDFESVNDYIHKVAFYEHECDVAAVKLKQEIFDADLRLSRKMHLRYFAENVESISDAAEAVSDRLAIYAIKRQI